MGGYGRRYQSVYFAGGLGEFDLRTLDEFVCGGQVDGNIGVKLERGLEVGFRGAAFGAQGMFADETAILETVLSVESVNGWNTAARFELRIRQVEPPEISLSQRMRLLVADFFAHNYRDITARKTIEWGQPVTHPNGNISIRYKWQATIWDEDQIISEAIFTFTPGGAFISVEKLQQERVRPNSTAVRVYQVNRSVSDFPAAEDFSSPETAYAAINRVMAADDHEGWQRVSVKSVADRLAQEHRTRQTNIDPEWSKVVLNAQILEVRIEDDHAVVIAEFPQHLISTPIKAPIDYRHLILEDGKWLNKGENRYDTVESARAKFDSTVHE